MEKIGRPKGLISYSSENAVKTGIADKSLVQKILNPKTLCYILFFWAMFGFTIFSLMNKTELNITIIKERAPYFTLTPDGKIRNAYTLKLQNKSISKKEYLLSIEGLYNYTIKTQGMPPILGKDFMIQLEAESELELKIFLESSNVHVHELNIYFVLKGLANEKIYKEKSIFIFN
jgi:polyferredoxin